jgi:galactokinase
MPRNIEEILLDNHFFSSLFGEDQRLVQAKRRMLKKVWSLFKDRYSDSVQPESLFLISVPNRVEVLGKHTDYQGGETVVFAGPKNFFAICGRAKDDLTELMNAESSLGTTRMKFNTGTVRLLDEATGSHYSYTVAKRLLSNMEGTPVPTPCNVKAVFCGDIPFGGGSSGSSSKLIMDFLIFTSAGGIFSQGEFRALLRMNALKADMVLKQGGVDDFLLPLSMYLAHYENGLDFGELKGDRGVGTFGGSEDHTAILLGEIHTLLYCRFCPTEVIDRLHLPEGYTIVVAYSGRRAEKTRDTMAKYNSLSFTATEAVKRLNCLCQSSYSYLRDFYTDLPAEERAFRAATQLEGCRELSERAFHFFQESAIIDEAAEKVREGRMEEFGRLISRSHDLSRDYLKNIVPEIEFLQKSACELGALGASGFGAGFGGSCYALTERTQLESFLGEWKWNYTRTFPEYGKQSQFDFYPACMGAYLEKIYGP